MEKKQKLIRANFLIDEDQWMLFRTLCSRVTTIDDDGTKRQATASDVLRELIWEWTDENKHLLSEALKDLERIHKIPEEREE
jgi:hypothetical protein